VCALAPRTDTDATGYQLFMLVLSCFSIAIIGAEASGRLEPEVTRVLGIADIAICAVFLIDFSIHFIRAENRTRYFFTWGWIDLLSSIPAFEFGRLGRLVRIFRIFRILRGIRHFRGLWQRRAENALLGAALAALVLLTFTSISVLTFETAPNSNINTAYDATWWAVSTLTTVGYGDRYPVTPGGRLTAVVLMGLGLGLLSTFSAFLASWFIGDKGNEADLTRKEIAALRAEIQDLRDAVLSDTDRVTPDESPRKRRKYAASPPA
jgi:voltage-gated potassium channel